MKRFRGIAGVVLLVLLFGDACSNKTHYTSCDEMRKDHAAPVGQGEVNYDKRLDRDHDGLACEEGE